MLNTNVKHFLRNTVFYMNGVNIGIGLFTGALDVYVSVHTDIGLGLGIYSSLASSFLIGCFYYFTYANTAEKHPHSINEPAQKQHTAQSKTFLALSALCAPGIIINSFYGEYTGNNLLLSALDKKQEHENVIRTLSTLFATSFMLGATINALLMFDNLVEHLKKEQPLAGAPLITKRKKSSCCFPFWKQTSNNTFNDLNEPDDGSLRYV